MFWQIATLMLVTTISHWKEAWAEECPTGDAAAYLQSRKVIAVDVSSDASEHQKACEIDEINSGICTATASQPQACSSCTSAAQTVPTNASRFPAGSLLCENALGSSGSACQDSTNVFTFDDPNDFLVCKGENTCARWPLQNVGAVCCSTPNSCGEVNVSLALQGEGSCISDMCCDGQDACKSAEVKQVNSLSCRGDRSCSSAFFDVAQNLYCNSNSLVAPGPLTGPNTEQSACSGSKFTFPTSTDRCTDCHGLRACYLAQFFFNAGTVFHQCFGGVACERASTELRSETKMRLHCSGEFACTTSQVKVFAGAKLHLICSGLNACVGMLVTVESGGTCHCQTMNGAPGCPSACAADETHAVEAPTSCFDASGDTNFDSACCAGNASATDPSPQCSSCGCKAPRACEIDEINSGICGATASQPQACSSCTSAAQTVPTNASRFPAGSLLCENALGSSGSACQDSTNVFTFDDPNDFLVCKGENTCSRWPLQNVGAVCCSTPNSCGEVNVSLALQGQGSCISDMCCDGQDACKSAEVKQVNSLSCRGDRSCSDGMFDVAQNLYCNSNSLVAPGPQTGPNTEQSACSGSKFTFPTSTDRCTGCHGLRACYLAQFFFNAGTVFHQCFGGVACERASTELRSETKMRLHCFGEFACTTSQVKVFAGAKLHLICSGLNACVGMLVTVESGGTCHCQTMNGAPGCPSACAADETHAVEAPTSCFDASGDTNFDSACCAGNASATDPSPQCSSCGCKAGGGGLGDPHVYTLDGQHYMLLQQGTFSFWHFSGLEAELSTKNSAKKSPVEFNIYAHYSGHASYTKGLLLVDSSGGEISRQVLEITSEDCQWRGKQPDASWKKIDDVHGFRTLSLPDSEGDEMTAFKLVKSAKGKMHVELLMKQLNGSFKNIGKVFVYCRPRHFINTKVSMLQQDVHFVEGQLGPHNSHHKSHEEHENQLRPASLLQGAQQMGRTDQEFRTSKSWTDLGGSETAAKYLSKVDQEGPAFVQLQTGCSQEDLDQAKAICEKHLGSEISESDRPNFMFNSFQDCVFDVCHGGGEVAAELAAEILSPD